MFFVNSLATHDGKVCDNSINAEVLLVFQHLVWNLRSNRKSVFLMHERIEPIPQDTKVELIIITSDVSSMAKEP